VTESLHADVLEDGARGPIRAGPPKSAEAKQLGASRGGSANFDAAAFREND